MKVVLNLEDVPLQQGAEGTRFAAATGEFGPALGLFGLGAALHVVPPGKTATPFHRHHTSDEMFLILSGTGTYRYGEERLPVRVGDCLSAPAGGEGHQLINTGDEELRYIAFSNNTNADVVEYLDSGRIRVDIGATGHHRENATFGAGGKLMPMGYWDGEDTGGEK
ncbi:MAG TPA: cupin domain-containing protein [Devosia sp.]|jgi:uncharacterized cupin superfamily protein|uniref:cupin domain-containing protein n=1 Tax=Devosia sp. TaxID=1871048 RepID=UPI002DDCBB4B|nr:cupin domain-containing protein [Devosia sp.]HEV2517126.1 cupin domain-containing protein [Devosia sp.]